MPLIHHASLADSTRLSLTPQGEAALAAADLEAEFPALFASVEALARRGVSPQQVARHAAASGASPYMASLIEEAVCALQA